MPDTVVGNDAVMMGIGQGPIAWTPLHAANTYATIARGGTRLDPVLVEGHERNRAPDVPIPAAARTAALDGLWRCVHEPYGSASGVKYDDGTKDPYITASGVDVWAKTGTAQTARRLYLADTDGDGRRSDGDTYATGLSNAWFVCLVGPGGSGAPMYAVAVVVEFGGSGGRVSGPIANQIIMALQHEGYLPQGELALAGAP